MTIRVKWVELPPENYGQATPGSGGFQAENWVAVDPSGEILANVDCYDGRIWGASTNQQCIGAKGLSGSFISVEAAKKRVEWWMRQHYAFEGNTNWTLVGP